MIQHLVAAPSDEIFAVIDGVMWRYFYPTPSWVEVDGKVVALPRVWTRVELPSLESSVRA